MNRSHTHMRRRALDCTRCACVPRHPHQHAKLMKPRSILTEITLHFYFVRLRFLSGSYIISGGGATKPTRTNTHKHTPPARPG
eukprot:COSAG01_NODE_21113_length_915_cov_1.416870_2_plen_82_part_01